MKRRELTYERWKPLSKKKPGPTARARATRRRKVAPVRKSVRATCVDRAESCCERCGTWLGSDGGHAHHRIPRSRGGKWTVENIEYICPNCHREAHRTNTL